MAMLTEQDFKRIGEELGLAIEHNLMPQFERMDGRFDRLEGRIDKLEETVASLPTKDFVDEKIGILRGDMVAGFRRLEHRMDRMIDGAPKAELEQIRLYPGTNRSPI